MFKALTAVYPLSADPPTLAHGDVLSRAMSLFETVVWAIGENPRKKAFFPMPLRLQMLKQTAAFFGVPDFEIVSYSGATVRFAQSKGAKVLVKGLRDSHDLHFEHSQAAANHDLDSEIETVFLLSKPQYSLVSSGLVRELLELGESVAPYVVPEVAKTIEAFVNK